MQKYINMHMIHLFPKDKLDSLKQIQVGSAKRYLVPVENNMDLVKTNAFSISSKDSPIPFVIMYRYASSMINENTNVASTIDEMLRSNLRFPEYILTTVSESCDSGIELFSDNILIRPGWLQDVVNRLNLINQKESIVFDPHHGDNFEKNNRVRSVSQLIAEVKAWK